jgi:S1-C subfamily serine protease
MSIRTRGRWFLAALVPAVLLACLGLRAQDKVTKPLTLDPRLKAEEEKRVAVVNSVKPAVVAILNAQGNNGGSGVVIDEDGYCLTNFHVVEATGVTPRCGMADGILYDGILVGLDKVGDVALIKLLPKKIGDKTYPEGGKFKFAKLGDSDKVKAGDWSLAMGNPFLLATDFDPTVTYGLISGVHRYQYPAGTLLEYTDCIQIDTSINPGNSGGPLFNMQGELIGINGRGSFEKRGRVNSGVGYAISINQIKNFMGQLRAGMDTDHASLGADIKSSVEDDTEVLGKPVVRVILEGCDARRRGLQEGDELVYFVGRTIGSDNEYKNYLGLYPRGWRVPITYRRENKKTQILVRLMGVQRQELPDKGPMDPKAPPPPPAPKINSPFYKAKAGFANYYFNEQMRDKLLAAIKKQHGDFSKLGGNWTFQGTGEVRGLRSSALVAIKYKGAKNGANDYIVSTIGGLDQNLEPLKGDLKLDELKEPIGSGGLLVALYHLRHLFAYGPKEGMDITHGGLEPYYLPNTEKGDPDYAKLRVDAEVLRTSYSGVTGKWYFSTDPKSYGRLLGCEVQVDREEDPCEIQVLDTKTVGDHLLPSKIDVRHGNNTFAVLDTLTIKMEAAK